MRRRRTVEPGTGPHQPLAGRILGTGLHLSYFCRRYTNVERLARTRKAPYSRILKLAAKLVPKAFERLRCL